MTIKRNISKLETLRIEIGVRLAEIAEMLDPAYKLTFVARFQGEHTKTIIVTDDENAAAVAKELTSSDDLLTIQGE